MRTRRTEVSADWWSVTTRRWRYGRRWRRWGGHGSLQASPCCSRRSMECARSGQSEREKERKHGLAPEIFLSFKPLARRDAVLAAACAWRPWRGRGGRLDAGGPRGGETGARAARALGGADDGGCAPPAGRKSEWPPGGEAEGVGGRATPVPIEPLGEISVKIEQGSTPEPVKIDVGRRSTADQSGLTERALDQLLASC